MPGQVGEEGTHTLPHDGWEVYHQTAVKGVPRNLFGTCGPLKNFSPAAMLYGWLCLCFQAAVHRQGCCLAADSHAWTKGTWRRRRMALCHTGTPEKREADSLGQCEMGVCWVRYKQS